MINTEENAHKSPPDYKDIVRNFLRWILMNLCFIAVPAFILYIGIESVETVFRENQKKVWKNRMSAVLEETNVPVDTHHFICSYFKNEFRATPSANHAETIGKLWKLRGIFDDIFDFIVWNNNGRVATMTFDSDHDEKTWMHVGLGLRIALNSHKDELIKNSRAISIPLMRSVLGAQFMMKSVTENNDTNPKFVWPDSTGKKPLLWCWFGDKSGALLLFHPDRLLEYPGVKSFVRSFNADQSEFSLGMLYGKNLHKHYDGCILPETQTDGSGKPSDNHESEIRQSLKKYEKTKVNVVESEHFFYLFKYLKADLHVFAVLPKSLFKKTFNTVFLALIFLFSLSPVAVYTFRIIVLKEPDSLSIKWKVTGLFLFANGLPLMVLAFIAYDYIAQKRIALLNDAHRRGTELLQNFDSRLFTQYARYENTLKALLEETIQNLNNSAFDEKQNDKIRDTVLPLGCRNYFFVASSSLYVGNKDGITKTRTAPKRLPKRKHSTDPALERKERREMEVSLITLVCRKILKDINGETSDIKGVMELELFAEAFMQKSLVEIIHTYLATAGKISNWSFATTTSAIFTEILSLAGQRIADFMFVTMWATEVIQENYLIQRLINLNRNPLGLRVIAVYLGTMKLFPENVPLDTNLAGYVSKLTSKPTTELTIIEHDGKEHLATGFIGKELSEFALLALYPTENAENEVSRIRRRLVIFGILSLMVSLSLAGLLSRSFLIPVRSLNQGAHAIEQRRFDFRLQSIGHDEFGKMAEIFNTVMVGLEELQVARVVQESLFPTEPIKCGCFSVYGKSVTTGELGGDYFDYFLLDHNYFCVLVGDATEHGVGAALIMAMAKAVVLHAEDLHRSPQKMLEKLNRMFISTKRGRQKTLMTFQFALVDADARRMVYANAAHCSSLIVRGETKLIEEIQSFGTALGSSSETVFQEKESVFQPGDALFMFTNGLVRATDSTINNSSCERLKTIISDSRNDDPVKWHGKICDQCLPAMNDSDERNDMTLIVMVCENSQP